MLAALRAEPKPALSHSRVRGRTAKRTAAVPRRVEWPRASDPTPVGSDLLVYGIRKSAWTKAAVLSSLDSLPRRFRRGRRVSIFSTEEHLAWRYRGDGVVRKHGGGELEKSHGRAVQWTLLVLSATEHGA